MVNEQNEGWGRNVVTGRQVDLDHTVAVSSKWLLDLGATRFTLAGDYTHQSTDISGERNLLPGEVSYGGARALPGYYDTQSNLDPTGVLKTGGVSLHAEHSFDFAKLLSISSYRETAFTSALDLDETRLAVIQAAFDERVKTFTQELQLSSSGAGPLRWIVGAFYMHRDGYAPEETLSGLAFSGPPFGGDYSLHTQVVTETGAPYAQATYSLTPNTNLTGGVRYTIEKQSFDGDETNKAGAVIATVPAGVSTTFTQPTFRAAIDHHFTDTIMTYASFNTGFKSGLYNANSLIPIPARPETVEAYEVGLKSDLLDHRLRFDTSVFDYSYKNIQLLVAADPTTGAATNVVNAARAKLYGLDVSVDAVPIRRLTLSVGASFLPEAEYEDFKDSPLYVPKAGGGNNVVAVFDASSRMIRAPRYTQTLGADYVFDLGQNSLDLGANLYYSSSFLWNTDGRFKQSPYATVNSQATYKFSSTGVHVSLWVAQLAGQEIHGRAFGNGRGRRL